MCIKETDVKKGLLLQLINAIRGLVKKEVKEDEGKKEVTSIEEETEGTQISSAELNKDFSKVVETK